jgi:uncharacterized protein
MNARSRESWTGAMSVFEPLRASRVGLLTTYRRDGRGVGTPVGIQWDGEGVYFTTRAKTWKVKRLARNPKVLVAPCTRRGQVLGEAVACMAHRVERTESSFQAAFWRLIYRLVYRDAPVTYELRSEGAREP